MEVVGFDAICRVCYEDNTKNLITPCLCSGTAEYIHETCLKNWISYQKGSISTPKCEICGFSYKTKIKIQKVFNPRKGIQEEFLYCCMIPIFLAIIISMTVAVIILSLSKLDFENKATLSWVVVGGCVFSVVTCLVLLILAFYKILYIQEVTEWKIFSIEKSRNSLMRVLNS
jgi:hypothetical protein